MRPRVFTRGISAHPKPPQDRRFGRQLRETMLCEPHTYPQSSGTIGKPF